MSLAHLGRRFAIVVLVVVAVLFLWSTTSPPSMAESPSPDAGKKVLRIGWARGPDNLNPFVAFNNAAFEVFHLNYDFLVGFKAGDLTPVPELATDWSVSDDGLTWTFNLRHGVKWQDGEDFTARDVVFTFNYMIDNDLTAYSMNWELIKQVVAVDDYTVRFECSSPKANMTAMYQFILPEHIWSKVSAKEATTTFRNGPPTIGTGPFQVVEYQRPKYVKLVPNKYYWGEKPSIDELIFVVYQNVNTMETDLKLGTIDAAVELEDAALGRLGSTPGILATSWRVMGFDDLTLNSYDGQYSTGNPVLRDPAFRRALNWAIDREKIAEIAYMGNASPAYGPTAPGWTTPEYAWTPPESELNVYDPDKAGTLLDEAGYKDADGDGVRENDGKAIELRLLARTQSPQQQKAAAFIEGWFKDVGINVELSVVDEGVLSSRAYNYKGSEWAPDFDMLIWGWTGNPDPDFILSLFTSAQQGNWGYWGWQNAEYDRLYDEERTTLDPSQRQKVVWQMDQLLYSESPTIFLVYPNQNEAVNTTRWTGWVRTPTANGGHFYINNTIESYLKVKPMAASTSATTSSNTTTIVIVVVAVAVAVAVVVWILLRRRQRAEVE